MRFCASLSAERERRAAICMSIKHFWVLHKPSYPDALMRLLP